jgi:hypothetical protein
MKTQGQCFRNFNSVPYAINENILELPWSEAMDIPFINFTAFHNRIKEKVMLNSQKLNA